MPNYTSVDKKYTEKIAKLVEVTCMHTMILAEMHSLKKEENKMLDVHALRGERYMCVHGKKDYTSMFDLISFGCYIRNMSKLYTSRRFVFLRLITES